MFLLLNLNIFYIFFLLFLLPTSNSEILGGSSLMFVMLQKIMSQQIVFNLLMTGANKQVTYTLSICDLFVTTH